MIRTAAERVSDLELVVTRTFDAPPALVFAAWTRPEHFARWWVPKSFGLVLLSCDLDARTGGRYRLVFKHGDSPPMTFFGTYLEVTPCSRLVWTNEEAGEAGSVTTVTFEDLGARTKLVLHERYPTKAALDEAIASGSTSGMGETLDQLGELLAALQG